MNTNAMGHTSHTSAHVFQRYMKTSHFPGSAAERVRTCDVCPLTHDLAAVSGFHGNPFRAGGAFTE